MDAGLETPLGAGLVVAEYVSFRWLQLESWLRKFRSCLLFRILERVPGRCYAVDLLSYIYSRLVQGRGVRMENYEQWLKPVRICRGALPLQICADGRIIGR